MKKSINNITRPVYELITKETKKNIQDAIQADKDILSQIVASYNEDEDNSTITFPTGIVPLRFYLKTGDLYVFFDYKGGHLYNEYGNIITEAVILPGDINNVVLRLPSEITIEDIDEVMYINISGILDIDNAYNWYAILNPQPAGTKLYKHTILDSTDIPTFVIISSSSTPIVTQYKEINNFYVLINIPSNIINFYCLVQKVYWGYIDGALELSSSILTLQQDVNLVDTVTEL